MTVTINTLGTNSRQIVISSETSATNIINAVNTSLTALGWTLIDTVTSGSRGLQTTKVYSAPNADSVTTKYMIIRYDLHRQYWFVSCCESWNTTTNVATNESWYGGRNILLPLQYSNTILYVFATARYACFMGTVRGEPSAWQGVFEFERSAPEDIAANTVPCFGWTSSLTIGEPYGNFGVPAVGTPLTSATSANNGPVAVGFAPPRTANSLTGLNAANNFVIITGIGEFPIQKSFMSADYSSGGITQTLNSHCGMLGSFSENMSSYVWDPNGSIISNLKLAGYTSFYPVGKIFGLKITGKLGAPLETTIIPVDANLFYSPGGTNTNHALFGIHGGYKDKLGSGTNRLTPTVYGSGTSLGVPWQSVIVSGRFLYLTTTTGFHKFDLITLGYIYNILPAQAYTAVKFDGGNSLYITTGTTAVYKLNLTDDTYTTYTSSVAVSGIAIDDDNLYLASNNTTGTTGTIKKLSLSSFTETASWTISLPSSGYYITHLTTADYAGYLYVGILSLTTNSSNRITRILTSDGTNSFINPPTLALPSAAEGNQPLFFDGEYLYFIYAGASGGPTPTQMVVNKINISNFTFTSAIQLSNGNFSYMYFYGGSTAGYNQKLLQCFELQSYAGMQMYFYIGLAANPVKISFSDPRIPNGLAYTPGDNVGSFDSVNNSGAYGQPATDGCSFYTFSTTTIIRYVGAFRNYNFNGTQTANILIAQ